MDRLYTNAAQIKPIEGYEDIVVLGDRFGFVYRDADGNEKANISVEEFAEIVKGMPSYHGSAIRLISCESGAEGAITAQYLADMMGVNILAPSDIVWVDEKGHMTIGPTPLTNTGEWVIFKPRGRKR